MLPRVGGDVACTASAVGCCHVLVGMWDAEPWLSDAAMCWQGCGVHSLGRQMLPRVGGDVRCTALAVLAEWSHFGGQLGRT